MIARHAAGRRLMRLAPAFLLAAVAVCGPFRRNTGPPPALLVFTNDALTQADVFVVTQGIGARRIGTVLSGRTDTLVVPWDIANRGTVNIVARMLARSAAPQTGPVSISPGERYEVRLSNDARILSFLPART
jgi:hypothetical protein